MIPVLKSYFDSSTLEIVVTDEADAASRGLDELPADAWVEKDSSTDATVDAKHRAESEIRRDLHLHELETKVVMDEMNLVSSRFKFESAKRGFTADQDTSLRRDYRAFTKTFIAKMKDLDRRREKLQEEERAIYLGGFASIVERLNAEKETSHDQHR